MCHGILQPSRITRNIRQVEKTPWTTIPYPSSHNTHLLFVTADWSTIQNAGRENGQTLDGHRVDKQTETKQFCFSFISDVI